MRLLYIKIAGFALALALSMAAIMSVIAAVWLIVKYIAWLGSPI